MDNPLQSRLASSAFAFRGYNTTNLGRTPELLEHWAYGPIVARYLVEATAICNEYLGKSVDLVGRVRARRESTIETFGEDIGLIVAVEMAHLELLREFFDVEYRNAKLAVGYSLGEITALVAGGVFSMHDVLHPLISLARDCVDLARDVTMGIVFSRGPALDFEVVSQLCLETTAEGHGTVAISAQLSPNTVLVLGQANTVDRLKVRLDEVFDRMVHVRKNRERWPPLHTPLLWERSIPNRAAFIMQTIAGGFSTPKPPVVSLVTGKPSYHDYNSRSLLHRWIDHPQKLWDALYEILNSGVEQMIHVGPEPNLIPATFKRLSDNITAQLDRWTFNSIGMRAMSGLARRPWLTKVLSSRTALLRIPYIEHVIVEDWLLTREIP